MSADTSNIAQLSAEQHELINLLRNELAEYIDANLHSGSQSKIPQDEENDDNVDGKLFDAQTQCETIGHAAELVGLDGLSDTCALLAKSYSLLGSLNDDTSHDELTESRDSKNKNKYNSVENSTDEYIHKNNEKITTIDANLEKIKPWAIHILAYLQSLIDTGNTQTCIKQLLDFLQSSAIPVPIDQQHRADLELRFKKSTIVSDDIDKDFCTEITKAMVSLDYHHDARQELIDGLLIELPVHEQNFNRAINRYIEQHRAEDLEDAQRTAHTIKGSANVVGVQGVANLVHYLEDVLQAYDKHLKSKPSSSLCPVFDNLLIESSDCLANMVEYLLGIGFTQPSVQSNPIQENTITVMQCLLNWHNYIHQNGWPDDIAATSLNTILTPYTSNPTDTANTIITTNYAEVVPPKIASLETALPENITENPLTKTTSPAISALEINSLETVSPKSETDPKSEIKNINDPQENTNNSDIHAEPEVSLRVAETLIDELLRLAGENIIANTRILTGSDALQQSIDHIEKNHISLRKMAENLEQLVDIKGAAANKRHKTENLQQSPSNHNKNLELDELEFEEYNEFHTFAHQLLELTTDTREFVEQIDNQLGELKNVAVNQSDINRENHWALLRTRMLPANSLSARFSRCVRQTCRQTGKAARLVIKGDDILIDSHVLNELADPIMHLLRNAIDHGIESHQQQRIDAGKSSEGIIEIEFIREGESVNVLCRDDGQGFDINAIENTALEQQLMNKDHQLTKEQLQQLVFKAGFSTRDQVSQTSGRGVGLDVVRAAVRQLKGSIHIETQKNLGSCFTLKLPMTLLSNHAMLIRSDIGLVSVISRGIEQLLFIEHSELTKKGAQYSFNHKGTDLPIHNLDALLHTQDLKSLPQNDYYNLLITQKSDGEYCGVLIDSVLSSRDIVVKPLNRYCYKSPGVIGATILGSGAVSPVLDLPELLDNYYIVVQKHDNQQPLSPLLQTDTQITDNRPMALVVDDSLSVRRSLAQLVADMGMEVRTAKDGFEAIDVIQDKTPTIMLVDLEMPRMNGLELTEHLRARDNTRNVPVIMITSRTTEKHRALAKAAGVNNYVMKPYSEDELLEVIRQEIPA